LGVGVGRHEGLVVPAQRQHKGGSGSDGDAGDGGGGGSELVGELITAICDVRSRCFVALLACPGW